MRAFTVATLALVASLNVEAFTTSSLPKSRDALTVSFGVSLCGPLSGRLPGFI